MFLTGWRINIFMSSKLDEIVFKIENHSLMAESYGAYYEYGEDGYDYDSYDSDEDVDCTIYFDIDAAVDKAVWTFFEEEDGALYDKNGEKVSVDAIKKGVIDIMAKYMPTIVNSAKIVQTKNGTTDLTYKSYYEWRDLWDAERYSETPEEACTEFSEILEELIKVVADSDQFYASFLAEIKSYFDNGEIDIVCEPDRDLEKIADEGMADANDMYNTYAEIDRWAH